MEGLQDNLCQVLRQRQKEFNMNNQSFDETNKTIGLLLNGGGRVSTLCSAMKQMGLTEVVYEDGVIVIK